ncbi:MAG: hypothetical protein ABSH15_06925 [Verrucomicrobiota bacterium]
MGRYLLCCFAGLALAASAQSQAPGQNPDTNGPVAIPPDAQAQPQPQPGVQPQLPPDLWDRWKIQKVSENDDWTRHFRIGAMVGLNISANFSTKGTFNISKPAGVYDDGYVRTDNTGNAFGQTGYWGYNSASQLSGSSLTMQNTTSYTTSGSSQESGSAFPGFDMAYGGNLWYWGRTRIGWDLGFGLLPISITDNRPMSATVNQTTYIFNTGSIVVPGAPYQGGFNRQGEPTIPVTYTSSSTNIPGTITGSSTLDVMLYTVRLGPSVYWDLNQYLGLSAGAGPAVGIVSGSLKYNEMITTTTVASNKGQIDATDLVYGGYVNATLMYHVPDENGDLYVGVQYMSLGNATISGGGRQGQLNLGGQVYITAGINWPF